MNYYFCSLLVILNSQEAVAREIGADRFVVSSSKESMEAATNSLDLILNTVSANHDINLYLPLLVRSYNYNQPLHNQIGNLFRLPRVLLFRLGLL